MKAAIRLLVFFGCVVQSLHGAHVGLCIMATGKYIKFVQPLISSARKHFCANHSVHYFVFTDQSFATADDSIRIEQKRLGWPHDTLMRFEVYAKQAELLEKMDYVFALDADMRFVGRVGDEILADRVATRHPGFVGKRGTYETNPISTACVKQSEGRYYFAGGFYGGSREEFLKMARTVTGNIKKDLAKSFIAVWHDESHLNRYYIDNPPTKILSPAYCYPENRRLPYPKKLLALVKNHAQIRE